jgi:hypothetical protein
MLFKSPLATEYRGISSGATSGSIVGQAFYGFGDGTYSWTCPAGVTSVCVVCIGGGAGSTGPDWASGGGGGGGLGWKNNISVSPGTTYTVQVGKGGDAGTGTNNGGQSFFIDATVVAGNGGTNKTGGTFVGDGGGNGGVGSDNFGGGGAGGYTGSGGSINSNGSGGGGSGGGSYSSTYGASGGGGTGPFGQGASGVYANQAGGGGSGGESTATGQNPSTSSGNIHRPGGLYGGGGGGPGSSAPTNLSLQRGGRGCVRIIWGAGRSFPSTGTGDM